MARKETTAQFEIGFYEGVLRHAPEFVEALTVLGDLYTKEGFYAKGLDVDERLARLRPDDPVVLYNLACSYSLLNDVPRARASMVRAFVCGYDDWPHLEQDPDLLNLLADAEFVEMLKSYRAEMGDARPPRADRKRDV